MARTVGLVFKGVENVENHGENTENTLKELSYTDLKSKATALGLEFNGNIKKDDLIALIEKAEKAAETPDVNPDENPELDPDGEE